MKILLAHNSTYFPSAGGGDRSNRFLLEALAARGHHCRIVARTASYGPKAQEDLVRELSARGVPVLSPGSGVVLFGRNGVEVHTVANHPNLRAYFAAQVESFAPDVILASTDDPAQVLLEAALRQTAARVVYLARATLPLPFGPDCAFPSAAKTAVLRQTDAFVGVSEYVAGYARNYGGIAHAVHVPISLLGPGPFPALGRFDNEFVLMVNPSATKGIAIFVGLARAMPETRFAAIPSWGTTAEDLALLKTMANVTVLDAVDDIAVVLKRTRAVLVPSLWAEARSRMVLESLIHGVPVLASDVGGLGEALMGVPHLLPVNRIVRYRPKVDENMVPVAEVPEQDIRPWREALERLLTERAYWEEISAMGRERALDYAARLTTAPLEAIFERVLSEPPRRLRTVAPARLSEDKRKLLAMKLKSRQKAAGQGEWFAAAEGQRAGRLRLFCFPFAGGGAGFFRGWGAVLGDEMEVVPALLPGREARRAEAAIDSFAELVERLYAALVRVAVAPYALFGHSMGAVLAYEIARRLEAEKRPEPVALVVSGARAPKFRLNHKPGPEPGEEELVEQLKQVNPAAGEALASPAGRALLLPALRADTRAYRNYVYRPGEPLAVPILAFGGAEDPQVSPEQLAAWGEQTRSGFSVRLFPGGHFYLRTNALEFLRALAEGLRGQAGARRQG
jgi:surfactin synthase thioesterase subunit/glycosyltransferase involved in cell wall biosynthesis